MQDLRNMQNTNFNDQPRRSIASLVTKNNVWNSVFLLWMVACFLLPLTFILIILTVLLMPFIINKLSLISFTADKKFIDIDGKEIITENIFPKKLFLIPILITLLIAIKYNLFFSWIIIFPLVFLLITVALPFSIALFCIFKNFPIAIFFHQEFQKKYGIYRNNNFKFTKNPALNHPHSFQKSYFSTPRESRDFITDPAYSTVRGNAFYRR